MKAKVLVVIPFLLCSVSAYAQVVRFDEWVFPRAEQVDRSTIDQFKIKSIAEVPGNAAGLKLAHFKILVESNPDPDSYNVAYYAGQIAWGEREKSLWPTLHWQKDNRVECRIDPNFNLKENLPISVEHPDFSAGPAIQTFTRENGAPILNPGPDLPNVESHVIFSIFHKNPAQMLQIHCRKKKSTPISQKEIKDALEYYAEIDFLPDEAILAAEVAAVKTRLSELLVSRRAMETLFKLVPLAKGVDTSTVINPLVVREGKPYFEESLYFEQHGKNPQDPDKYVQVLYDTFVDTLDRQLKADRIPFAKQKFFQNLEAAEKKSQDNYTLGYLLGWDVITSITRASDTEVPVKTRN